MLPYNHWHRNIANYIRRPLMLWRNWLRAVESVDHEPIRGFSSSTFVHRMVLHGIDWWHSPLPSIVLCPQCTTEMWWVRMVPVPKRSQSLTLSPPELCRPKNSLIEFERNGTESLTCQTDFRQHQILVDQFAHVIQWRHLPLDQWIAGGLLLHLVDNDWEFCHIRCCECRFLVVQSDDIRGGNLMFSTVNNCFNKFVCISISDLRLQFPFVGINTFCRYFGRVLKADEPYLCNRIVQWR